MNSRPKLAFRSWLFYALWFLIVAISVHDGYLVMLNRWSIADHEQNPLGRWLLAVNGGEIYYFLFAKFVGTVLVSTFLLYCYWKRPLTGLIICIALAMLQIGLLTYLVTQ